MRPEGRSKRINGFTQARARMYEFSVPDELADIDTGGSDPATLLSLVIGILGDEAARINDLDMGAELAAGRILPSEPLSLRFAAAFLHAYVFSRYGEQLATELLTLSAAGYYLCDLAGSAGVLIREATDSGAPLDHWDALLRWLLSTETSTIPALQPSEYSVALATLATQIQAYFAEGTGRGQSVLEAQILRKHAYSHGTGRDLLYADLISAVTRKRLRNAARYVIPAYSGLSASAWKEPFSKPRFMKELWPSQHVFGERGLLQGRSAVVQMPTSAGKTRGIELIVRSAFYAERARLAVVVAPFRALCTEITGAMREAFKSEPVQLNELSDALLVDYSSLLSDLFGDSELFGGFELPEQRHIIVLTPEKLLYVLRHSPELINAIGVVVYDEGHQFDSGQRGVTYELLLTSIKRLLSSGKQTVLISAVITNAEAIGRWLIGDELVLIEGSDLSTTRRSVAFASWRTSLGQLQFVDPHDPEHVDYFVPRLIEQRNLTLRPRERTPRAFPNRSANSVALYLGLQVVKNGSVALYCGKKATAGSIIAAVVDAFTRGLEIEPPSTYCDPLELLALRRLYAAHFGDDADVTQAANLGIFSHHGNTPQGIRLSVEIAMKEGLARFVVCTSTLAQGVNLPIRYLIVSGTMQGVDRIKARDFHNLIGRAGRAGMHTEGTVIFSDPDLYDQRFNFSERWRWKEASDLLNPLATEKTTSSLLDLLSPFHNQRKDQTLQLDINDTLKELLVQPDVLQDRLDRAAAAHAGLSFTREGLRGQLKCKRELMDALESYLMANRGVEPFSVFVEEMESLAAETLAFALGSEAQKLELVRLLQDLARYIEATQPDTTVQAAFGKTLLGLRSIQRIREWVAVNQIQLLQDDTSDEVLLRGIWPLLLEILGDAKIGKYLPQEQLLAVALGWIDGATFAELLTSWQALGGRIRHGTKTRATTLDDMVNICENVFGYESTLIIAAVSEMLSNVAGNEVALGVQAALGRLLKRMKYGLALPDEVVLYELGFADRTVAGRMRLLIADDEETPIRARLRSSERLPELLQTLPRYFQRCYDGIL